ASRRIDWTYTGVPGGIPNRTNICATFSPGATASAISNALNSCKNGVVFLNAGTYSIEEISVSNSNVTLRGAGANQTILKGCNPVNLGSGSNSASGIAISGATKGSFTFTVASTAGLFVNQMIELGRADDATIPVVATNGSGGSHMTQ